MKTVLITGGSSGIGAEMARQFADAGYRVAISYRANREGAEEVLADIEALGAEGLIHQADLCEESQAQALVEVATARFGAIDVLINNAGGYLEGDEWDKGTAELWTRSLQQNLVSVMSVSKYVIPFFQKQRSGVLLNIASRHGMMGDYEALSYAAAKAGVINITEAYAKLLAPHARANTISPGAVNTGYWRTAPEDELQEAIATNPMGRLVETSEVAAMALHLASDNAAVINGQNIVVDGGCLLR